MRTREEYKSGKKKIFGLECDTHNCDLGGKCLFPDL
jgi:hypothetical protein